MTTWILTDEAGRAQQLGDWVFDMNQKVSRILSVVDLRSMKDDEVKAVLARHGVEIMLSEDLQSPIRSELKPSL